jgi:hypothetical protein
LGYGDIAPITSSARTLSAIQAVLGQMYLAVLIARLVGLHIAVNAFSQQMSLASPGQAPLLVAERDESAASADASSAPPTDE